MTTPRADSNQTDVVLRDGSTLLLREARPEDEAALRRFHERLSRESLYFRFFTIPKSSDAEVARLNRADPSHDVVLVGESGGEIRAVASYTRNPRTPDRAEVAFAIADPLQGRGVGTRLLERLAEIARRHGIKFFDADVLGENTRMLHVFEDSGFVIRQDFDSDVYHVVLSIEDTEEARDSAASRAIVAASASMTSVFVPRRVVVIGANRERGKIGSELLHNVIAGGYTGQLFVVHPSGGIIDGVTAYRAVRDIPEPVDLAVICVPAAHVLAVTDECIAKGVKAVVVISAGFSETGPEGQALEAELVRRVRDAGVRLVGPNCMGLINADPAVRLNATFAPIAPRPGRVALSTQSGALGIAILDYARQLNIGFSTFVSVGNKADVSGNDLIQYWAQDPGTDVILLYLESFGNPRKFTQIARRVSRLKPIVAVKAGRSKAGARAASSHTGALAASDAIVDALFHQAGVIRTDTLEELFDVAALLANQPLPRGRRVGILTNAGGPGILAADTCEAHGLEVPSLSDQSIAELRDCLPSTASTKNPVDMIASASAAQYEQALGTMLRDENVDAVLVIFIPPLVTQAEDVASAIRRATDANPGKPVVAVCMSTAPTPTALGSVPGYRFPEAAAIALARAAAYGSWRLRAEGHRPRFDDVDRDRMRGIVDRAVSRGGGWILPDEASGLLEAAGITVARKRHGDRRGRGGRAGRANRLSDRDEGRGRRHPSQDGRRRNPSESRQRRKRSRGMAGHEASPGRPDVRRAHPADGERWRRDAAGDRRRSDLRPRAGLRDRGHAHGGPCRPAIAPASADRRRRGGHGGRTSRIGPAPWLSRKPACGRAGTRRRHPATVGARGRVPGNQGARHQSAGCVGQGCVRTRRTGQGRSGSVRSAIAARQLLIRLTTKARRTSLFGPFDQLPS